MAAIDHPELSSLGGSATPPTTLPTTEPLRLRHNGRTLVVYVFHKNDRNVRFFFRHGLCSHPNVDYAVVRNDASWPADRPSELKRKTCGASQVTWITRPNRGNDWGAYGAALRVAPLGQYDYFLFVNSTMRGPFLPPWFTTQSDGHWSQLFTSRLNDTVALVGSSVNFCNGLPHVQSMLMAMDHRGLKINMKHDVLFTDDRHVDKDTLIARHEIGSSYVILREGYNLDCMLAAYQGKDWRQLRQAHLPRVHDVWGEGRYFGHDVHPYETVFFKTNRYHEDRNVVDLLTSLLEHAETWHSQPNVAEDDTATRTGPIRHAADEVLAEVPFHSPYTDNMSDPLVHIEDNAPVIDRSPNGNRVGGGRQPEYYETNIPEPLRRRDNFWQKAASKLRDVPWEWALPCLVLAIAVIGLSGYLFATRSTGGVAWWRSLTGNSGVNAAVPVAAAV